MFHPTYDAPDATAAAEQAGLFTHWRAVGVVMHDTTVDPASLIALVPSSAGFWIALLVSERP